MPEVAILDLDQHLPAIVAGDAEAFAAWLAGAEPQVRASLRRFATHVDTEAVLQEALLRVWQVAPRYPGDGAANGLLRLCVRIARNLAISEARRSRSLSLDIDALQQLAGEAEPPEWQDTGEADPRLRQAVHDCRERLPRQPARALAARLDAAGAEADRSLAARLGMRLNTFLQNVTRARKLLADCLRRRGVALKDPSRGIFFHHPRTDAP